MKTIKYLSDGKVAKVGMRVKDLRPRFGFISGKIVAINPLYKYYDNRITLDSGILVKSDFLIDSDLYNSEGTYWTNPEDCEQIK